MAKKTMVKNETMNAAQQQVTNESPMMKQFREFKAKHPDALLLFRCGDFYEAYQEDAKVVADICGVTLTKRNDDDTAMAGFPHHALDTYLPKIIRAGKRVAICDQLEDPKLTKRLVKRGITELAKAAETTEQPAADATAEPEQAAKVEPIKVGEYTVKDDAGREVKFESVMPAGVVAAMTEEPIVVNTSAEEEKPKVTLRRKNSRQGGYKVVTMAAKRGGVSSKLYGFASEKEAKALADKMANSIRCTWDYGADGEGRESKTRHYYLWLGTRYVDVAQELCRALNEGDKVAVAQAAAKSHEVYAGAVAENQGQRKPTAATPAADQPQRDGRATRSGKTYSEAEVAALMQRVLKGDAEALQQVNAMLKAA